MTDNREERDDILAARAADAMDRLASVAKGKDMSGWEDESGSRIRQTTPKCQATRHHEMDPETNECVHCGISLYDLAVANLAARKARALKEQP